MRCTSDTIYPNMLVRLTTLLEQVPEEVQSIVQRTRDRTRSSLQEALRAECRLAMRTPEEFDQHRAGARVPVEITPGCPAALSSLTFDWDTELIRLMTPYRSSLIAVRNAEEELLKLIDILTSGTSPAPSALDPVPTQEIQRTIEFSKKCLIFLEDWDPIKKILLIESDVLGEYRFEIKLLEKNRRLYDQYSEVKNEDTVVNLASIRLYWAVIGFFSRWTGWKVEDLAIVVLTHELAHAYTQLGADIDGRRWPASIFSRTDTEITEGLAQYYADRVLRRLCHRYGGAYDVFKKLLKRQSKPYQIFEEWQEFTPESVRLAMLEMRRSGETKLDVFTEFLEGAHGQLHKRK